MIELSPDFGVEYAPGIVGHVEIIFDKPHFFIVDFFFFFLELKDAKLDGLPFLELVVSDRHFEDGNVLLKFTLFLLDVIFSPFRLKIFLYLVDQFCFSLVLE